MLRPLEQFVCDECGAVIMTPWDGLIEWVNIPDGQGGKIATGFRIIHQFSSSPFRMIRPDGCSHYAKNDNGERIQLNVIVPFANLFVLSFLDNQAFPDNKKEYKCNKVADIKKFAVLARRLTVPYYEQARLYFHHVKEENLNILNLKTENLQNIILKYADNEDDL